jgi:hypothetical protein
MALLFPSSPTPGQIFSNGANNWTWDGTAWVVVPNYGYIPISTNLDAGDVILNLDAFNVETAGDIIVIDAMFAGPVATIDFASVGPATANPI